MQDLINRLNEATKAYDAGNPIMSDAEWDKLYFQLQKMENESGIILPDSPTHSIYYQNITPLKKITHNHPMLSLEKTKNTDEIIKFCGKKDILVMNKLDGLTCSLRYIDGRLVSAETRGNGLIGEDILHNALVISSIPKSINYTEELIVDGEIIIKYDDFVNFQDDYKNPRNFAAGSIRLLDSQECAKRKLTFIVWEVIKGFENINSLSKRLVAIKNLGFTIVPNVLMTSELNMYDECSALLQKIAKAKSYPTDGLVFKFDDISYGQSLGSTAHHNNNAMAFKFYDDVYPTTLIDIDWTMGRSGQLTPVAVFEPVEIEGTEVTRASLHNLSIMIDTLGGAWKGRPIQVYKANLIIPQIMKDNLDIEKPAEVPFIELPTICPICGKSLKNTGDNLICENPNCEGQLINRLDHFCGKKGLDIKGLSKATLDKLLNWNWVNSFVDIFNLKEHRNEWIKKPGFGEKSVDNILAAIDKAKITSLEKFIAAIGIPLIGHTVSKELVKYIESYSDFRDKIQNHFDFSIIDGFAENKTANLLNFNYEEADKVASLLTFNDQEIQKENNNSLKDMVIVITGSLNAFKNRDVLQQAIEEHGGKVTGSISKKTSILINNDINSTSSKNNAAKKLGVPILTEKEFIEKYLNF